MGSEIDGESLIRRLYAEHGSMLLAYATRWSSGDRQHGEDAVQETLIRAWRRPLAGDVGSSAERAWLLTVVRNVCIDRYRARQSRPREVGGDALESAESISSADDIDRAVEQWTIAEAFTHLSLDHRAVLQETYFNGLSVAEAARLLGIPEGTVKSRAFHALRALRKAFESQGVTA